MAQLIVTPERFPIRGSFTIARGSKSEAAVVLVELHDGGLVGRGECVPYARYDESVEDVAAALTALAAPVAAGMGREKLSSLLPPGAARNAIDCAFWDLEAKRTGKPAYELAGLPAPQPAGHRLHHQPGHAGSHGRGGPRLRPRTAQAEARHGRRSRAHRRGARRGARHAPHRRCQ